MLENIPEELKKLNQWVCVAADSKAPINPYTGFGASSDTVTVTLRNPEAVEGFTF